ncbi:tetratricopeptide repeat protein [Ancylobacter sp. WKF20]|uniref:tetratricopeptide repeat protein n=1 Tax=Ancylobacter sp. WKF20 TaxID=3039801 RepID=UPI00243462A2|nr:tetratricopeptide repeat protein [Ancylobacter sp. WKF20]WGD31498.1 tetratricopeptide repeat protein [Ancylobacter sp. WKF20]
MRIFERPVFLALIGAAFGGAVMALAPAPARAFDGSTDSASAAQALPKGVVPPSGTRPLEEVVRFGAQALRSGDMEKGIDSLRYAADQGHAGAQWKLGRMYAEGEGVERNDIKAFEYFTQIANLHADDNPSAPQARFVADAFVALGGYYLVGIPNKVRRDPNRARDMFAYAASYFGDPDAQYHLARLYIDGDGVPRDPRFAARWLGLAAHKGQYQAQAALGGLLFKGDDGIPRQGARGLMWLTLARDAAAGPEDKWVVDLYEEAFAGASSDERAMALVYLEQYMKNVR